MVEGKLLIIFLYVDDFILIGDEQLIISFKGVRDEEHVTHALFPWFGSMARRW